MGERKLPASVTERVKHSTNDYGPIQLPKELARRLVTNGVHGKRLPIQGTAGKARHWISVGGQMPSNSHSPPER